MKYFKYLKITNILLTTPYEIFLNVRNIVTSLINTIKFYEFVQYFWKKKLYLKIFDVRQFDSSWLLKSSTDVTACRNLKTLNYGIKITQKVIFVGRFL